LLVSEELCPRALAGQILFERDNPDEWKVARRLYREASAEVDAAMSLPESDSAVDDHFSRAEELIDRSRRESNGNAATIFDGKLLDAYLPAFHAEQAGETLSEEERTTLRQDLNELVDWLDGIDIHESEKRGLMHKLCLPLLFARSNVPLLPALAREGQNKSDPAKNFDVSAIVDGHSVPIKCRGSLRHKTEYDTKELLFLPLQMVVSDARPDGVSQGLHGREVVDDAISLLADEVRGIPLDAEHAEWLDAITHDILDLAREFIADPRTVARMWKGFG
jgi:uncharacterized membrane protein